MANSSGARTGPLAGVRIIDITAVLMGPSATQMMADLGADVIKIEPPEGDMTRRIGPMGDEQMGPLYLNLNRNKRSVVLDLKQASGRDALLRLVETADVLTYNVRPQAMERLQLSYDDVAAVNPRIVYAGMFGFSQRGRYGPDPAFDDLMQAATGLPYALATTNGDGVPRYIPSNLADRSVGLYAFGVIASALYAAQKTGVGQRVDIPMFETMVPFVLGDHFYGNKYVPRKGSSGYPRLMSPVRRPYRTKDGHICCVVYSDDNWRAFLEIIGQPELLKTDPRLASITTRTAHIDELYALIETHLVTRTNAEWQVIFKDADIPVAPVHTFDSLVDDPHLNEIGFFREVEHPAVGTIREMAVPSEWHGTPPQDYRTPPGLGEHSCELLREVGYSEEEISRMLDAGVTRAAAQDRV